jgi:probable DNA metabolism protein
MQTLLYDGSFEGWLCAVFDVYEYRLAPVEIVAGERFKGNLFGEVREARLVEAHSRRVWKGLEKRLSPEALEALYRAFLSEEEGIEDLLLRFVQYVFAAAQSVEKDYSHEAVLRVTQLAKTVWREKHRMEAFVRFQQTADGLYFALIEPEHNVLPLLAPHFTTRYADQQWVIWDGRRRQGLHYDGEVCRPVTISFNEQTSGGQQLGSCYGEEEAIYQQLWQAYFKSVNIAARKNTRLQLQHMPRRYWKHLTEMQPK